MEFQCTHRQRIQPVEREGSHQGGCAGCSDEHRVTVNQTQRNNRLCFEQPRAHRNDPGKRTRRALASSQHSRLRGPKNHHGKRTRSIR